MKVIEVEFDTNTNANVLFPPMQRVMRGGFDVRRMSNAGKLFTQWPEKIPGQRLQLDPSTGEAAIVEPLWDAQHSATRERIESKGMKLAPGRETVTAHVPTWLHWLKQLVDSGKCKLVTGTLPTKIDGVPQTRFHSTEQPEPIDKLTAAIDRLTPLLEKLLSKADASR